MDAGVNLSNEFPRFRQINFYGDGSGIVIYSPQHFLLRV
jgi:hypothetical protein